MGAVSSLWRKQRCEARNAWRQIRSQPRLKIAVIGGGALCFEVGLLFIFADAFRFLERIGGAGALIVGRLFSLFFLGLGVMIAVSGLVTAFTTFFRSAEIAWLMTSPFTARQIVIYKHIESASLASWAFFAVMLPFMAAYAWYERLSPAVALWTIAFAFPFLHLCAGVGTIAVLVLARWLPQGRRLLLAAGIGVLVSLWLVWSRVVPTSVNELQRLSVSTLVPGMTLAANPLLPSWWVSEGIDAFARQDWLRGTLLLGLLTTSALVLAMAIEWIGERTFHDAWQRVLAEQAAVRRAPRLLPRWLGLLRPAASDVRAILSKDVRTFLRDPVQWSQALVFFGLLGLFFYGLSPERYAFLSSEFRPLVAFLNVFSVAAVICSLGSRFVYPQLSMEGQAFWILGLSPTSVGRLVLVKFVASGSLLALVSAALVALSSYRLGVPAAELVETVVLMAAIAVGSCGLATGLGAIFLDLKQPNPAAIVSGFGGTLNLVLNLGFVLAAILPFALAQHLEITEAIGGSTVVQVQLLCWAWLASLTAATTAMPLTLGIRSLRRRDY
jgi:ABC-2 type transport system permease protein